MSFLSSVMVTDGGSPGVISLSSVMVCDEGASDAMFEFSNGW